MAWRARWFFPEAAWGSEREATEARLLFPLLAPWVVLCRGSRVSMVMCTSVALAIMKLVLGGMWMDVQGKHQ